MRVFFDIVSEHTPSYDFSGSECVSLDDAARLAELIASDLGCSETNNLAGSQLHARNAAGETLFVVPVSLAA
jgi:hypothetical protein